MKTLKYALVSFYVFINDISAELTLWNSFHVTLGWSIRVKSWDIPTCLGHFQGWDIHNSHSSFPGFTS